MDTHATHLVLGTAGHIDHGKSSLVLALTGIDPDRLKEEKKRGITIELGFARLDLPGGGRLGIVDVPGHEKFVRAMVAGVTGVDLVCLVVAADEGIMPQTREHVDICRVLGVRRGLVVLSKIDLVDDDWLDMVREEIGDFVAGTFLEGAPVVGFSAKDGRGLEEVRATLDALAASVEGRTPSGPFRLPIDRVFTMKGFGTVVTGTVIDGTANVGDELVSLPGGAKARIRGAEVHGEQVERVTPGNRTAINLQGVATTEIERGEVLVRPGTVRPTYLVDVRCEYLASAPRPLRARERVRFHTGTAEVLARAVPLEGETVAPGASGYVQLRLEGPAVCLAGDRFVLRSYSPVVTIGGGTVVNPYAAKHKAPYDEAVKLLDALDAEDDGERLLAVCRAAGSGGIRKADLQTFLRLSDKRLAELLGPFLSKRLLVRFDRETDSIVDGEALARLYERLVGAVADYHAARPDEAGMPKAELVGAAWSGAPAALVEFAADRLVAEGRLVAEKDRVRAPDHRVVLAEAESAAETEIVAAFAEAGLTPPTVREAEERFARDGVDVARVLKRLTASGRLVPLSQTLFLEAGVLAALKEKLAAYFAENESLDAQAFKQITGLSRKFAIPILEFLDKDKFTVRVGDARVLRKKIGG